MGSNEKNRQFEEKRGSPRAKCHMEVGYALHDNNYTAFIHDISLGGAFITSDSPARPGETIAISIQIEEDMQPVTMIAEVIRVTQEGFGVKFTMGIDTSIMNAIIQFQDA